MEKGFEDEFIKSMDTLCFPPEDKARIAKSILRYQNQKQKENRKNTIIKKWISPKAAAIFAVCIFVTGGTSFAASRIVLYTASSHGNYDYTSIAEMNAAASGSNYPAARMPKFPETLGSYTFDGGNIVNVRGKDDAGNTFGKWDDLHAVYKNADGSTVKLVMSVNLPDKEDRTPTETRTIGGITVTYNYDEYLVFPDENEPLEAAVKKRLETDDHFYVSYGSSEKGTCFYSGIAFVTGGISCQIFTTDEISADTLFDMAAELIGG